MIQMPRSLARLLRAVFRKLVKKPTGTERPLVAIRADRTGLRVRLHNTDVLAEFEQAGSYSPETVAVPFDALADFDGKGNGTVILADAGPGSVEARWDDGGVPQVREYDTTGSTELPRFPSAPADLTPCPGLLQALANASASAARDNVRYAMSNVQLRGRAGEIIGTDGRQLLLQSGFRFPFTEDVLISSTTAFGCKELNVSGEAGIGANKEFVTVRVGAWTLYFRIDKEGRFPNASQVIPSLSGAVTRCRFNPEDVSFLVKSLSRLPGGDDDNAPVTVDLDAKPVVRASGEKQSRVTEVVLVRSEVTGKAVRFNADRNLLARALELGFTELAVVNADTPIICQDERRKFVFMPLEKKGAIGPSEDAVRIVSGAVEGPSKGRPQEKRKPLPVVPFEEPPDRVESNGNGHSNGNSELHHQEGPVRTRQRSTSPIHDLLDEMGELRNVLRDAFTRTHRLMVGLQKHKKKSQVVQSTLASLRQLQHLDAE